MKIKGRRAFWTAAGVLLLGALAAGVMLRGDDDAGLRLLPASEETATPEETAVTAPPEPFALSGDDLECATEPGYTRRSRQIERPRMPGRPSSDPTETTETTETTSTTNTTAPIRYEGRLVHLEQRSPQDVLDNVEADIRQDYAGRLLSHVELEITEEHDDKAQLAGRHDGKLVFLATVVRDEDGMWEWIDQEICDDMKNAA
jgi:hypothetical protein